MVLTTALLFMSIFFPTETGVNEGEASSFFAFLFPFLLVSIIDFCSVYFTKKLGASRLMGKEEP
jgi:hypothetical protein